MSTAILESWTATPRRVLQTSFWWVAIRFINYVDTLNIPKKLLLRNVLLRLSFMPSHTTRVTIDFRCTI